MKAMILGANGLCGSALMPLMEKLHPEIEVIAIDPDPESKPPVIVAEPKVEDLWHILRSFGLTKGDILIDLAPDLCKLDVMQAADSVGVSVVNATSCEHNRGTIGIVDSIDKKLLLGRYNWECPHIPSAGMNPGTINAFLGMMVDEVKENPIDVTQWELDSTTPFEWDGEGFATWSPEEFASEYADESTWQVNGKQLIFADGAPIDNIVKMPDGNYGAICQHEELLIWGWRYGCKARYLYGYPPKAMTAIENNIRDGLDLALCRKLENRTPTGGDRIGLEVKFESVIKRGNIYVSNDSEDIPIGSNATSYLVACGVATAVQMLKEGCESGINWPDDFAGRWIDYLKENQLCEVSLD